MGSLKFKKWVQLIILSGILLTSYVNCSQGFNSSNDQSSSTSSSLSSGTGLCEDTLMGLYSTGYYQFVRTNCATCHATDADKPQFASPDLSWAYKVFMDKGYSKVSNNAISSTHQPPYSGPQHTQTINELRLEWQKGIGEYNQCKGSVVIADTVNPSDLLTLETVQKTIPTLAIDASQTVTWTLNSDLNKLKSSAVIPNLPNAKFSFLITRHKTQGGEDYYTFSKPYIFGSTVDVHLKTIYIKINGRLMTFPTTFKFVDTLIRAGSLQNSTGLVSTGALTAPGAISAQDMISVAFEKLESVVLPAPLPPVLANFSGAQVRFADSATGTLNLEVALSAMALDPVTLTVEEDGSAMCGAPVGDTSFVIPSASCLPEVYTAMCAQGLCDAANLKIGRARSVIGNSYNRYDWDYKFNISAMTLIGADNRRAFTVNFSKDIRREENRVLRLRLNMATTSATAGLQNIIYIVVRKINNPLPVGGEITFSQLMTDKGILNQNCVKCHNSRDLNGGYDMTDYAGMLAKSVIIPGSTQSKMFRRMNANDPANINLTPMPVDGFMIDAKISAVSEWVLKGAKNN